MRPEGAVKTTLSEYSSSMALKSADPMPTIIMLIGKVEASTMA
jgi:hypothetical protein